MYLNKQDLPLSSHRFLFSDIIATSIFWLPLLLIGSYLLSIANETYAPFLAVFLFVVFGLIVCAMVFSKGEYELRSFLLSFSVCVLVAGVAQNYSLITFGELQSTRDAANSFFPLISESPPFTTMQDIPVNFNSPLAILIWQRIYALAWLLGMKFGLYTGVLCNAFVVGLSGATTVAVAREVFGNDHLRLRRLSILVSCCGLFWLFGAILIRDCFILFINVMVLWRWVVWMNRPSVKNFIFGIVITGIASYATFYLRQKAVVLFGLFFMMSVIVRIRHMDSKFQKPVFVIVITLGILLGFGYIRQFSDISLNYKSQVSENYLEHIKDHATEDSLGMKLVVNQPLPIKLVLGCATMAISPIPIWCSLKFGASEYHLIKNFNGIYQIIIMPLVIGGIFMVFHRMYGRQKNQIADSLFYLAIYSLVGILSVVATSLEQRHFVPFLPALLILAVLPDIRETGTLRLLRKISLMWYAIVILVHVGWLLLKL
ncbi:hypothetical protein [Candidatus Scalindua japonica]|uniref:hypothetical protein n=1 Tax=Candidatus Scalindua japonica TaxID=1284222 RepID=UPI000BDEF5FC|nr:hypothetical protein [Candidatus Scalindua japonica]